MKLREEKRPRGNGSGAAWKLVLWSIVMSTVCSFQCRLDTTRSRTSQRQQRIKLRLGSTEPSDDSTVIVVAADEEEDFLQGAEILSLTLEKHRPLGCTVEESLGEGYEKIVFCSKVTPNGFADKAGVKPGDVFIGVSGPFGIIEEVTRAGIDRVRSLVSACPDDEPLVLRLARGTFVLDEHEAAIVELCSKPGNSDKEVDECVTDFLKAGYYTESSTEEAMGQTFLSDETVDNDDGSMLDEMFNMWAEDLPGPPVQSAFDLESQEEMQGNKPKPWSSRSSPSGTFVRDPRTGRMKNIDA